MIISDSSQHLWVEYFIDDDGWPSSVSPQNDRIIMLQNDFNGDIKIYNHPHRLDITWERSKKGRIEDVNSKELRINWNKKKRYYQRFSYHSWQLPKRNGKLCHVCLQDTLRGTSVFSCNLFLVSKIAMYILHFA